MRESDFKRIRGIAMTIKIASHRRSGTHLAMVTLAYNFEITLTEDDNKTHLPYDRLKKRLKEGDQIVYVLRDGRDVMLSCFQWWQKSKEAWGNNIIGSMHNKKFIEFLQGIEVPDFKEDVIKQWEMDAGMLSDPIMYWMNHVRSYLPQKDVIVIKYEDLKNREKVIELGKKLGLKMKTSDVRFVNQAVGYYIGGSRQILDNTNKWKRFYSSAELKAFNDRCGDFNHNLGYDKER
ncbi:MAG: sulfotransferase domain-containing protein [bacterium]|nr:sulfotransferase domain-containing protein [bacterium]